MNLVLNLTSEYLDNSTQTMRRIYPNGPALSEQQFKVLELYDMLANFATYTETVTLPDNSTTVEVRYNMSQRASTPSFWTEEDCFIKYELCHFDQGRNASATAEQRAAA